jgi:hypothetical protein
MAGCRDGPFDSVRPQAASNSSAAESVEVSSTGEVSSPVTLQNLPIRDPGSGQPQQKYRAGDGCGRSNRRRNAGHWFADNSLQGVKVTRSQSVGAAKPGLGSETGLSIAPGRRSGSSADAVGTAASESGVSGVGGWCQTLCGRNDCRTDANFDRTPEQRIADRESRRESPERWFKVETGSNGAGTSSIAAPGLMKAATGGIHGARGTEPTARLSATDGFAGGTNRPASNDQIHGSFAGLNGRSCCSGTRWCACTCRTAIGICRDWLLLLDLERVHCLDDLPDCQGRADLLRHRRSWFCGRSFVDFAHCGSSGT